MTVLGAPLGWLWTLVVTAALACLGVWFITSADAWPLWIAGWVVTWIGSIVFVIGGLHATVFVTRARTLVNGEWVQRSDVVHTTAATTRPFGTVPVLERLGTSRRFARDMALSSFWSPRSRSDQVAAKLALALDVPHVPQHAGAGPRHLDLDQGDWVADLPCDLDAPASPVPLYGQVPEPEPEPDPPAPRRLQPPTVSVDHDLVEQVRAARHGMDDAN